MVAPGQAWRSGALLLGALATACTGVGQPPIGASSISPSISASPAESPSPSTASSTDPSVGSFAAGTPLAIGRIAHTATVGADGRILFTGGFGDPGAHASAELWAPVGEAVASTGPLAQARYFHTATLLHDGRALIVGGSLNDVSLTTAEIWDPKTGTFRQTGALDRARSLHTATLLADGRVLVVGGYGDLRQAEVWNPAIDTFAPGGSLEHGRAWHTATLLADGRVLIAGGPSEAELWDPVTNSFSPAGSMLDGRWWATATSLPDGRVLVAGGGAGAHFSAATPSLASAELWDPTTMTFVATGPLGEGRRNHTATLLPTGHVILIGGASGASGSFPSPMSTSEVWDPGTASFTAGPSLVEPRGGHTATPLSDGRVLVAGGYGESAFARASTELWAPPPAASR